ncbi:MAG: serine/threonine protein kinase [Microthrixaceae bacterium]|nr:serine/threonine protein kinase [Microthrixaceae bacterium]
MPRPEAGEGGEGPVFRARLVDSDHPSNGAEIALKLLTDVTPAQFGEVQSRLAAAGALGHRGLMRVIESFIGTALTEAEPGANDERDVCWVASEWVDGERLVDRVGSADLDERLEWIAQIAEAVDRLHTARSASAPNGVIHRDVKSSNVRITPESNAVLIDFGLARPAAPDTSIVGTPRWMAPEVMAGEPGGTTSDIWGVGAIAHDLLVGTPPPADGANRARERLAHALRAAGHPHAEQIATHLSQALDTDPTRRPRDLDKWATQLREAQERPLRPDRRRRNTLAFATVGLLVAGGALGFFLIRDSGDTTVTSKGSTTTAADTTSATRFQCNTAPELPDTPAGRRVSDAYRQLDSCAGPVESLAEAAILHLTTKDGDDDGALIAGPTQSALRLTDAQLISYLEIAGRSQPTNSVTYGGYPTRLTTSAEPPLWTLELEAGGLVIGTRPDTQGFWIPQQTITMWQESGGVDGTLGKPTSNTYFDGQHLVLEFERGYLEAALGRSSTDDPQAWLPIGPSTIRLVEVLDPGAALQPHGDLNGRVLRQAGGHAWFVDADGRHWIGSGGAWGCVEADKRQIQADIPGYAVATLPLGPPVRCDA